MENEHYNTHSGPVLVGDGTAVNVRVMRSHSPACWRESKD